MTIRGGLVVGLFLVPICLGIFLLRRELTATQRNVARLEQWSDDITDWIAEQFGGPEPTVLVDPATEPIGVPTEPMERVEVAGGLRTTRPTPFVRQKGRHAAPAVSRGERG